MIANLPAPCLQGLNILLFALHSALVIFNAAGWAFYRTRQLHILCLAATLLSWFGMGAVYGSGYCLCTDWHFQVRRAMGLQDNMHTFLQLAAKSFFELQITHQMSNVLAVGGLVLILTATSVMWYRDLFSRHSAS